MSHTETPEQIDTQFGWSFGTAKRLARRGQLPHARLPDGSIRFRIDELIPLIDFVPAKPRDQKGASHE
jgi:hypothetical protein